MAMQAVYGSYYHQSGECVIGEYNDTEYSPTGGLLRITKRITIQGTLLGEYASLDSQVASLKAAYIDGYDFRVLLPDGSNSQIVLLSAPSLTGTRVTRMHFPNGQGHEYATARTYFIELEATYGVGNGLSGGQQTMPLEWQETLAFQGNGGPRYAWTQTPFGPPVRQLVNQRTVFTAVQSGSGVGVNGYPAFPQVIWPQWLDQHLMSQQQGTPRHSGRGWQEYPIMWRYSYSSPVSLFGASPTDPLAGG